MGRRVPRGARGARPEREADPAHAGARAPAPPSPGCVRRGSPQRHHGRPFPRGGESVRPGAVLSHYCAACHRGWLRYNGRPIDVTAPTKRARPTIRTHRSDLIEREVLRQIPITPRLRTITDLAASEPEPVVKRALRQAKFTEAELQLLPRTGVIGRIVDLSAAPTASGNEDVVLDLVLKAGFEHPRQRAVPGHELHPRPLVAAAAPHRRGRQPRLALRSARPARRP